MNAISKPVLNIFAISHFCEKARWTLDYFDMDYDVSYLAPGLHMVFSKKLKLPATALPILIANGEVVQGSSQIIDWAEEQNPESGKSLDPSSDIEKCLEIEKRLDDVAGVHVRRIYYSEALISYPDKVRQVFSNDLTFLNKMALRGFWAMVRKQMIKMMDLGSEQRKESKSILEDELDWLHGLLSDGRAYLSGDKFSRVDLTAASLLSPLAVPKEHPVYSPETMPPQMASDQQLWHDRPSIEWVRGMYSRYR